MEERDFSRACLQNKEMREESTLFNRMHRRRFPGLKAIHWLYESQLLLYIYFADFLYNHLCKRVHEELTLFEKSAETRPFFMNTASVSMDKVDSLSRRAKRFTMGIFHLIFVVTKTAKFYIYFCQVWKVCSCINL